MANPRELIVTRLTDGIAVEGRCSYCHKPFEVHMSQVVAVMILIIAIGYVIDGLVFRTIEYRLQYKWGLTPAS